jgi:hypothetical protein
MLIDVVWSSLKWSSLISPEQVGIGDVLIDVDGNDVVGRSVEEVQVKQWPNSSSSKFEPAR